MTGDSQTSQFGFLLLSSIRGFAQPPFRLMPIRSYARSTDYHRKPCGKNVLCSVDISVVVCPTFRTIPLPDIKRQPINNVTAVSAAFCTGEPTVNSYQPPTIPLALVFQLPHQLRPTCISDSCTEEAVFHHVLHCQVFDCNRLVFTYQLSRQLVFAKRPEGKKIFTGISNRCLNTSNLHPCLLPIVRAFNSARKCFLCLPQLKSETFEMLGVSNLLPVTSGNQRGDSRIYSYSFVGLRQSLNRVVINQQRDEPASRGVQPYGYSGRFASLWQSPTPTDGQRLRTFCQPQLPILPFEGRTGKLGAATVLFLLKVRVLGTTRPKVGKRFLQISQSLLQRNTANFIKELQTRLLFPSRQHPRRFVVANPFLPLIPSLRPGVQRFVVDQANATQCAAQELFLFLSWVKALAVGSFSHVLHFTIYFVNTTTMQLDILWGLTPIKYPPFPPAVNRSAERSRRSPAGITGVSTGEER